MRQKTYSPATEQADRNVNNSWLGRELGIFDLGWPLWNIHTQKLQSEIIFERVDNVSL